ncbi:inositol-3-phosphate synthase [Nocardia sp. NPDC004722]
MLTVGPRAPRTSFGHIEEPYFGLRGIPMTDEPTGIWLIGARGSVATTVITGMLAIRGGMATPAGCVAEGPELVGVPLPSWENLVIGGHDIVETPLVKRAESLARSGALPHYLPNAVADGIEAVERDIRTGYDLRTAVGSQADAAQRLAEDILQFQHRHGLARVVVVDVASTEPPIRLESEHETLGALEAALAEPSRRILPASSLAAYAALSAGCPFVEFTPSTGFALPALTELARLRGLPYAGRDGKTGETLLRTVLAPMFTARALQVRSWAGTNLLGGGDGATLEDPVRAASKLASKAASLASLLGDEVVAPLHIDNVPDLGEVKTAWDHVSFEGFLGARMTLQLTWTGLDSCLAAPLVLDLARLVATAHAAGQSGPLEALAFFFKDPFGTTEHRFSEQTRALHRWAEGLRR